MNNPLATREEQPGEHPPDLSARTRARDLTSLNPELHDRAALPSLDQLSMASSFSP